MVQVPWINKWAKISRLPDFSHRTARFASLFGFATWTAANCGVKHRCSSHRPTGAIVDFVFIISVIFIILLLLLLLLYCYYCYDYFYCFGINPVKREHADLAPTDGCVPQSQSATTTTTTHDNFHIHFFFFRPCQMIKECRWFLARRGRDLFQNNRRLPTCKSGKSHGDRSERNGLHLHTRIKLSYIRSYRHKIYFRTTIHVEER